MLRMRSCSPLSFSHMLLFFFLAGITKAAANLRPSQEVKQEQHPQSVKPALSSYPSNGQIHSQYHGYYVKADVKVPPSEEPLSVEDDFHPSSLGRLPPPAKESRTPPQNSLPNSSPSPVPPSTSGKAAETSRSKRLESSRPKSLAETKKASVEIVSEIIEEETVSLTLSQAGWLFHVWPLDPPQYLNCALVAMKTFPLWLLVNTFSVRVCLCFRRARTPSWWL